MNKLNLRILVFLSLFVCAVTPASQKLRVPPLSQGQCGQAVYLVGPTSGSKTLYSVARRLLPAETAIQVLLAPGEDIPHSVNPNTHYVRLPAHRPNLSAPESLALGMSDLWPKLTVKQPKPVIFIGGEYSVDWGSALRSAFDTGEYRGSLEPSGLVSKSAIRDWLLTDPNITELRWPRLFSEEMFEVGLRAHIARYPYARLVAKLDNSSGMSGLRISEGRHIFAAIAELRALVPRHSRPPRIIVEEFIDDMELPPEAVAWQEVAIDGIAHDEDASVEKLLQTTFLTAWMYEKDAYKMYISDTLKNPNSPQFALARRAIRKILRRIGHHHGAFHFEIYVAIDKFGHIVPQTQIILGDPNLRFGGNNKFADVLLERGALNFHPLELLVAGRFNSQFLSGFPIDVRDGGAKVLVLNMATAPKRARFIADPMPLVREILALTTLGAQNIPWTEENWAELLVGRPGELAQTIEILLSGEPDQVAADEITLRIVEKKLVALMISVE